jgi:lipoyl(octanoyl) transferase
VHRSGRGGRYTYHGPGQRIGYVMLDVGARSGDVRAYVAGLEGLVMDTLAALSVPSRTIEGRVGVWVARAGTAAAEEYEKIAAIGVRLRRWVSSHGFSINVAPDLAHFAGIVPCGIADAGVTSLARLGVAADMEAVDCALRAAFEQRFGPTQVASPDSLRLTAGPSETMPT